MDNFQAKVTASYGTYTARGAGKSASCTAGEAQAVKALAKKVFGDSDSVDIKLTESVSVSKSVYQITKGKV